MSEPVMIRLGEVRGHDRAIGLLRSAVEHDRLPHALLFAGPDGVGKRLVALSLAAWLLCKAGEESACGHCGSCLQAASGSHPDLHVLGIVQGKKEIGIDRIRDVKRFVQLQPLHGGLKVAIINDAPQLTVAAQNALLKTLEEPPGHSLLILVANNADAVLPTVRSRCQRVQFAPLATALVRQILLEHGVAEATADVLAELGAGSPGRALALSASQAPEQRERLVAQLAGLSTARYVALMQLAQELGRPEKDLEIKLEMLLAACRDEAARHVEAEHTVARVLEGGKVIGDAARAIRRGNPNRQLLLEALLLRLARL